MAGVWTQPTVRFLSGSQIFPDIRTRLAARSQYLGEKHSDGPGAAAMSRESANQTLRQIRTLYALGAVGGLTDSQLVDRFLRQDGLDREDAFAALVQRHGPMVLRVCRRMLFDSADAEDAFQAVFLVLARKAGAVRRLDSLKSWLYGVAVRTAKEARRRSARRRAKEGGGNGRVQDRDRARTRTRRPARRARRRNRSPPRSLPRPAYALRA